MTITIDDVKDKLLTLNEVRERLAHTEPLDTLEFSTGDDVAFKLEPGFNHGLGVTEGSNAIDAFVTANGRELRLTRESLYEFGSEAKMTKGFIKAASADIVEDALNFFFRGSHTGNNDYKVLVVGDGNAAAITRGALTPYSNIRLLDTALSGIEAKYGSGSVFADYKFIHTLQRTHMRLIVPEYVRTIENTGTENDTWSVGIQLKNSLTGLEQTEINGYLFRYWCTNGAVDTRSNANAVWSRRGAGGKGDAVYEWAADAVDEVLGGLEGSLDLVQGMTDISIEGTAVEALRDVFREYRIPTAQRNAILGTMVNEQNLTMYSLMQAVTQAANNSDLSAVDVDRLMRVGGDLPVAAEEGRCDADHPCGRFLAHNH